MRATRTQGAPMVSLPPTAESNEINGSGNRKITPAPRPIFTPE
jgi:hypothetical protein